MDVGIYYSEILMLANVLVSITVTKTLSKALRIPSLSLPATKSDLKVTLLAISLLIILLVSMLSKTYFSLSFIDPVIWSATISFWVLSPVFAIVKGDFKLIGVSRMNLAKSVVIALASSFAFVALFVAFVAYYPPLSGYFRAPIGGGAGFGVLIINLILNFFNPSLTEELAFRVLLQSRIQAHSSVRKVILAQALIFGLFHITNIVLFQDWLNPINTFLSRLIFGYVFYKTGNILGSVGLHWFYIDLAYLVAFMTPTW